MSDSQAADTSQHDAQDHPVYPDNLPMLDQPAPKKLGKKRSLIAVASDSSYTDSHDDDSLSNTWYPPGEDSDGIVPNETEIGAIVPAETEIGATKIEVDQTQNGIVPDETEIGAIVPAETEIGATKIEVDETQTYDAWKYDSSEWWEEGEEEEFPRVVDLIESTSGEEEQPAASSSCLNMQTKVFLCSIL